MLPWRGKTINFSTALYPRDPFSTDLYSSDPRDRRRCKRSVSLGEGNNKRKAAQLVRAAHGLL